MWVDVPVRRTNGFRPIRFISVVNFSGCIAALRRSQHQLSFQMSGTIPVFGSRSAGCAPASKYVLRLVSREAVACYTPECRRWGMPRDTDNKRRERHRSRCLNARLLHRNPKQDTRYTLLPRFLRRCISFHPMSLFEKPHTTQKLTLCALAWVRGRTTNLEQQYTEEELSSGA